MPVGVLFGDNCGHIEREWWTKLANRYTLALPCTGQKVMCFCCLYLLVLAYFSFFFFFFWNPGCFPVTSKFPVILMEQQTQLTTSRQAHRQLQYLSDRRWACWCNAFSAFCHTYDAVVATLLQCVSTFDCSKTGDTRGLFLQTKLSYSFYAWLFLLDFFFV